MLNRASDDNLLKNIELFDKLAEKHRDRGLFIKDVIGSNEICCWTFYRPGGAVKKIAEVCCTSIVYATDKKHTKVFCFDLVIFNFFYSSIQRFHKYSETHWSSLFTEFKMNAHVIALRLCCSDWFEWIQD